MLTASRGLEEMTSCGLLEDLVSRREEQSGVLCCPDNYSSKVMDEERVKKRCRRSEGSLARAAMLMYDYPLKADMETSFYSSLVKNPEQYGVIFSHPTHLYHASHMHAFTQSHIPSNPTHTQLEPVDLSVSKRSSSTSSSSSPPCSSASSPASSRSSPPSPYSSGSRASPVAPRRTRRCAPHPPTFSSSTLPPFLTPPWWDL
ncbi:hypothetical protein F7725_005479 [Dissostichus mawsoni]|uniref:Uncharacterized protein n=1 Tax=Dissostichus mawsoni TaxID=36200 RepID=A0A7J5YRD2_DISMA|nr:hypothetical protein F7725_005479 [Dissostichus mawsoni]